MHADRLPASQPLGRYGHQRQLFEMVLCLVLVQERRLPVKPAANYVIHGQQVSLPTVSTRSVDVWVAVLLVTWGSDEMDLARLPGDKTTTQTCLTAHFDGAPASEI